MNQRIHISLPQDLMDWVKSIAKHEGRSISNFITVNLYALQEKSDKEQELKREDKMQLEN
ncbi:MAG: hypothetical protein GY845_03210 [Planctomycetes bacterium]|nr:hypothetical protein [Planctomycetota bacterium]